MLPDRVSNPGPLTYESGALPTVLCNPAAPILSFRVDPILKSSMVINAVSLCITGRNACHSMTETTVYQSLSHLLIIMEIQ